MHPAAATPSPAALAPCHTAPVVHTPGAAAAAAAATYLPTGRLAGQPTYLPATWGLQLPARFTTVVGSRQAVAMAAESVESTVARLWDCVVSHFTTVSLNDRNPDPNCHC